MARNPGQLSTLEDFVYLAACVVTLGGVWLCKIVIKKAMLESR
jgi:hypothetical protein